MSEPLEALMIQLEKSRSELKIALACVAEALNAMYERLDKVELWIENQKNPLLN